MIDKFFKTFLNFFILEPCLFFVFSEFSLEIKKKPTNLNVFPKLVNTF
jgi:hypothetical protein